jgi:hypothetical protein
METENTKVSYEKSDDEKKVSVDKTPEGLISSLDLSKHLDGSWPSSKNVSQ